MQVLVIALVIIPWPKLTHSIHSTSAPHMTTIGTASLYPNLTHIMIVVMVM